MAKTRDLKRRLAEQGCKFLRQGSRHEIWHNPATGARSPVPRHNEIPKTTADEICKQLGVEPL